MDCGLLGSKNPAFGCKSFNGLDKLVGARCRTSSKKNYSKKVVSIRKWFPPFRPFGRLNTNPSKKKYKGNSLLGRPNSLRPLPKWTCAMAKSVGLSTEDDISSSSFKDHAETIPDSCSRNAPGGHFSDSELVVQETRLPDDRSHKLVSLSTLAPWMLQVW